MEFLKSHLKASEGTDSFYNSELLPTNQSASPSESLVQNSSQKELH